MTRDNQGILSDDRFLTMLDADPVLAVKKYHKLREKLVWYFQNWRLRDPTNAADETIKRTIEKIRSGAKITVPLAAYCHGVARMVRLESHDPRSLEELDADSADRTPSQFDGAAAIELVTELTIGLERLGEPGASLLLEYAAGDRRKMAEKLKVTENALRLRVLRDRERLREIMGYSESPKRNAAARGAME